MSAETFALATEVDQLALRAALGRFATGVTVVTTSTPRGALGMTVNSFCSVSLTPPLVLFCLAHRSQLHPAFAGATSYAINVLAHSQRELSTQFARPGFDRFAAARWRPGTTGAPVLAGALAVLECLTERVLDAGDHAVVLGRVVALHPTSDGQPLVFFGGRYQEPAPVPNRPEEIA